MYLLKEEQENIDNAELIRRCRTGEQKAYTELIRRYKGRVASTVFGMLGRCDEADDVGQEVFIRFFNSIDNFRGEASPGTYLTRIAINLSINELRRRKLRRFLSIEKMREDGIEITDTDWKGSPEEDRELVEKGLQQLSAKYRSVLVLRLIEGYSTEETAKILNLPAGTVLSRLARAQMKLREYLKPYVKQT